MKSTNQELIKHLKKLTISNLERSKKFDELTEQELNWKPTAEKWSILECLEHLNRYGRFYIPEFHQRIASAKNKSTGLFKSTWLGEYFAQSVAYKPKLNKMNTFDNMNPEDSKLTKEHLQTFQSQQTELVKILDSLCEININKTKSSISISKWIKINIGDALRVVIYHNERHLVQAEKVQELLAI